MGRREILKAVTRRFYVERRKDGTFKKWTSVGKSLRRDRVKKAVRKVKSGFGHQGDRR
jgi:hypothetical protein